MRIKEGYKLCKVRESSIVVAVGDAVMDFNGIVTLNATGELIWGMIENGAGDDEIIAEIMRKYKVDESVARADFAEFADKLKGAGFVE
ncbi:MAG: PqqD family protein [Clostridiales bacterium]|jgi:hypothetical protein|nr:PqqD family protein [Clostridiales bacterium]